jgi:cellobiose-specific phosphotransferase system component IIA
MKYVMVKDRFYIAREEVKALTRLLQEAHDRQRRLLKKENRQSWWDWLYEWIGY